MSCYLRLILSVDCRCFHVELRIGFDFFKSSESGLAGSLDTTRSHGCRRLRWCQAAETEAFIKPHQAFQ